MLLPALDSLRVVWEGVAMPQKKRRHDYYYGTSPYNRINYPVFLMHLAYSLSLIVILKLSVDYLF